MLKAPGSDLDINGCIASAGFVWCEILGKCLRSWEEACNYPQNCLTWYDGCNTCSLLDGDLGACTEMICFQQSIPYCMVPSPDAQVAIEPWLIDPPVINPFLGQGSSLDGH